MFYSPPLLGWTKCAHTSLSTSEANREWRAKRSGTVAENKGPSAAAAAAAAKWKRRRRVANGKKEAFHG